MRESTIEKRLITAVKSRGGLCIKLPARWYRGIPDRLVLLPGARVIFIELKRPGGTTSKHQLMWSNLLSRLGFRSVIIEGPDQLKEFIYAL